MKLKTFTLITTVCLCLINELKAQQNKKTVSFLKDSGVSVSTRDSADYIRETILPDSGSTLLTINDFYTNGNKKFSGKTSKRAYMVLEGVAEYYYPSGVLKEKSIYKTGAREGDSYRYYRNGNLYAHFNYAPIAPGQPESYSIIACNDSTGKVLVNDGNGYFKYYATDNADFYEEGNVKNKLRDGTWKGRAKVNKADITFTEVYVDGKLTSGSSVDPNGKVTNYDKRTKQPQFTGGIPAFSNFLRTNLVYPDKARMDEISGTVLVSFIVNIDGSLEDIKVTRSPATVLSNEAIRVITKSPAWQPGESFGILTRVQFTQPIGFVLD